MKPSLGPNFEALDRLEFLARMSDATPVRGARRRGGSWMIAFLPQRNAYRSLSDRRKGRAHQC